MSITYTCNLCGETITDGEAFVALTGNGDRSENAWKSGWIAHYHSRSANDCWKRILDVIRAADASERRLSAIPTATYDEILARRDMHQAPPAATDPFANLSARTRELLERAGIDGIDGLRAILADGSVASVPGIGRRRLEEIRSALQWGAQAA